MSAIQEDSNKLQAAYAGEKAMEITNREREVVRAWMELQALGDSRKRKLNDTGDLFKFFAMVRNLMLWMDDLMRQMSTSEKPRDVSGKIRECSLSFLYNSLCLHIPGNCVGFDTIIHG